MKGVEIFTNSLGSNDYVVVAKDGQRIFESHNISPCSLKYILEQLGIQPQMVVMTDAEMFDR